MASRQDAVNGADGGRSGYQKVTLYDGTEVALANAGGYVKGADGKYYPRGYDVSYTSELSGVTYKPTAEDYAAYTRITGGARGQPIVVTFDKNKWETDLITKDADSWRQSELTTQQTFIEQQRAQAEAEKQSQIDEFNRKEADAKKAAEDQKAAFEADRIAREKAFNEAQAEKARQLGIQRQISGNTLLQDYARVRDSADQKLVAAEDKKVLNEDDKQQMFSDSDAAKKKAQTFIEKIKSK